MSLLLFWNGSGGSGTAYTLSCAVGSYTYTGQAATLKLARKLSLAAGAYVYTGQAATLTVARKLALPAGAYTYTGQAATLTYTPGASAFNYALSCAAGAYVYTGQGLLLGLERKLALAAGAYVYTGQDALLGYVDNTPAPVVSPTYLFVPDVSVIAKQRPSRRKHLIRNLLLLG